MVSEVLQPPRLSPARLFLLGASSVVLCLSQLMAVFAPFPMAMAVVLYGRARAYLVALLGAGICLMAGQWLLGDFTLAASYACMGLFALAISETLVRGWRPVRAVVVTGLVFLACAGAAALWYTWATKTSLHGLVTAQITASVESLEAARKAGNTELDLVDLGLGRPPAEIATDVLRVVPGYLFIATFFVLWVNMYLALKGQRLLNPATQPSHDERALLGFKMPFAWAYVVAAALALVVGKDVLPLWWAEPVGMNVLHALGVFYFFQGFGVMLAYLNHWSVLGFLRTLFVMGVVLLMPSLVAALGLFDTWFDFTRKIRKKENT